MIKTKIDSLKKVKIYTDEVVEGAAVGFVWGIVKPRTVVVSAAYFVYIAAAGIAGGAKGIKYKVAHMESALKNKQ